MTWLVCTDCGGDTNNPKGICLKCELKQRQKEKENMGNANKKCPKCGTEATSNRAESCKSCGYKFEFKKPIKKTVIKEKTCIDCGLTYKPTSNVQKRCSDCAEKHKGIKAPSKSKLPKKPDIKKDKPIAGVGVIDKLQARKDELQDEIRHIEDVIETIKKYS